MLDGIRRALDAAFPKGTPRRRYAGALLRSLRTRSLIGTAAFTCRKLRDKLLAPREVERWLTENHPSAEQLDSQRNQSWPSESPRIALLLPVTEAATHSRLGATLGSV